jgi:5-methyltetrahydrofolate--homocysteine methyltransferase
MAGGADVLWVETISAPDEFRAAALGIGRAGAPWFGTMSFDTAGRTMMGLTSADMVALVDGLAHRPIAFGANCGVGASDLLRTVLGFGGAHPRLPVIAKGNAGIPKFVGGHIHYDGTPELMADYAVLARDCGASIIGGCCGTTPAHLAAMRRALEATPPGPAPDLDTIAARLGRFSSTSDGVGGDAPGRERKRRRG